MALSLLIHGLQVSATADYIQNTDEGLILRGKSVSLEPPQPIVRQYIHGWQSWSLTAWLEAGRMLPASYPYRLHPLQLDPAYARHPLPHSSWVGALEFADGTVLLLGALGLEAHIEYSAGTMHGWYESGGGEWLTAYGTESQVFATYAAALAARVGKRREISAPRVWCSWYSYFGHGDETELSLDLEGLGDLPFDVFQVDDGWQQAIGDWEPNARFPSGMGGFARRIRAKGYTPGLWLAPLLASPSSRLFKEHPDWLLRDDQGRLISAGHNWGKKLYALDPTCPAVLEWLAALMKKVRGWGYDYLKLDFLYAGALPGKRQNDVPREASLRQAMQTIRDSLGDAYLLACGAPILPALGQCDGLRVGPDVAAHWVNSLSSETLYNFTTPGAQNAARTSLERLWLKPLVHTDPDVAFFRSVHLGLSSEQKILLQDLALIAGFRGTSDLPRWLTIEERESLRQFLQAEPTVLQLDRYRYQLDEKVVDFAPHIGLPSENTFKAGRFKRFVQGRSNSERLLALVYRSAQNWHRRRLNKK
jgi:alpha-galactosidase